MIVLATIAVMSGVAHAQRNPGFMPSYPSYTPPVAVAPVETKVGSWGLPEPAIVPVSANPGFARVALETPGTAKVLIPEGAGASRVSDDDPAPFPTPVPAPIPTLAPENCPVPIAPAPKKAVGSRIDFDLDFLFWTMNNQTSVPSLVTQAGVQRPTILSGNSPFDYGVFPGFRIGGAYWLGEERTWGLTANGFYLGRQADTDTFSSDPAGNPALGRPFVVAGTGTAGNLAVSLPGFASGSVTVDQTSELWGAEVNAALRCCECRFGRLTVLGGFRYIDLMETLEISQTTNLFPGSQQPFGGNTVVGPATLQIQDIFETRNQFYGPQFGLQNDFVHGRWVASVTGKIAMGTIHEVIDIRGQSIAVPVGTRVGVIGAGGVLAQPSNVGRYVNDEFAVVPEVGVKVGYKLNDRWTSTIGYNFLYVSHVLRPGNQIDPVVSAGQIVANQAFTGIGNRPTPTFNSTDFWAQGISFGLTYQY